VAKLGFNFIKTQRYSKVQINLSLSKPNATRIFINKSELNMMKRATNRRAISPPKVSPSQKISPFTKS